MKHALLISLAIALIGCVNRDEVARNRYIQALGARHERYIHGDISEAKQALHEILAEAQRSRGRLQGYYGTQLDASLAFGGLALIAEHEGDQQSAQQLWEAAVEAQLQFQKDKRMWGRSNPHVTVADEDSDVYEAVSPDFIRKFLVAELEKHKQVAWRREHDE